MRPLIRLAALAAVCLALAGLSSAPARAVEASGEPVRVIPAYKLGADDKIRIITFGEDSLSGEFLVSGSGKVSLPRYERLADAVRATLADAIERGGSTLRDFVGSNGESGYFQLDCFVYDRAGQPCRVCGTPIRQIVQGQRSTYFCATCQR